MLVLPEQTHVPTDPCLWHYISDASQNFQAGDFLLEHLLAILSCEVDRQPAYFEEDPRLRHQQNLPGSPARLKIAVSLRRLGERIRMFQPQLKRPLRNPLQYRTGTNL